MKMTITTKIMTTLTTNQQAVKKGYTVSSEQKLHELNQSIDGHNTNRR